MDVDEVLAQIETDKVTIDVRYTTGKAGKLSKMLIKEEDTVSVGQEVAVVEEGAEGSSGGGGGKKEVRVGTGAPPELLLAVRVICGRACGQHSREGNGQLSFPASLGQHLARSPAAGSGCRAGCRRCTVCGADILPLGLVWSQQVSKPETHQLALGVDEPCSSMHFEQLLSCMQKT